MPLLAHAQDREEETVKLPPKRIIKSNLLAILQGPIPTSSEYKIAIERITGPRHSILFSASYLGHSVTDLITEVRAPDTKYAGFRAQMMYRLYLTKRFYAPKGWFIGPHVSYSYLEVKENYLGSKQREFISYSNVNMIGGFQYILGDAITFEFFGGLGAKRNDNVIFMEDYGSKTRMRYGPKFSLGSSLGIVF